MNNRYCVIMSGGVGSRFWPFSRTDCPKQFLDFLGTGRSLIQMTYDRFVRLIPKENIFIASNEVYKDLILEQLPEIQEDRILLEPQRRNTAPCIAWAAYHIQAINPNANIVVAPSDHLILNETAFLSVIEQGFDFVSSRPALLTLGITPNRPETGYGYIQVGENGENGISTVKTFTEKPNAELAKVFVESGEFFWNAGIFLWNVQSIIKAIQRYLPEISSRFEEGIPVYNTDAEKDFIAHNFPACPNISIDFGVMEKASNVFMLQADFGWSDLGTWGSLYDRLAKDKEDNVVLKCKTLMYESKGNIVAVPRKLVVLNGLEDFIVAESDNVLLICKKEEEQRIRQFVTDAKMKFGDEFV
ncbi:MAG TPA: mannose-1-phosphate guanylyltransferase [Candidatus Gallibacteroides avistercoris]|uniref:mannose-1-phosphate guanylyltransferase n=1 Tax=Candidatus Gallibacteroides avistercoris TaxID=2840833 RepID=A0A9D1SCD7_9BACT|nr:mannose-1-phosphate guanylyltransferase [Candidatus Gallibacteroides avistercoris]